ncbi:hypothetical protein E2C01_098313 [Portunus trituberculatus]|uniref:Fibronectin type-II domain-containing protein n=1 Tax=Portunus trituberculatus TaxID=210409 RepID=A0A5B7KDW8_PORTR|nr:hypothetical protein [Portunus trituberculatus]
MVASIEVIGRMNEWISPTSPPKIDKLALPRQLHMFIIFYPAVKATNDKKCIMPFELGGDKYEECVELNSGDWCLVPDDDEYSGLKWSEEACDECMFK